MKFAFGNFYSLKDEQQSNFHVATITISDGSVVKAWLDMDNFQMKTNNTWTTLGEQAASGPVGTLNTLISGLSEGKFSLVTDSMSRPIWTGASPNDITFEFKFMAESDPYKEVWLPAWYLYATANPNSNGSIAKALNGLGTPGQKVNDLVNAWTEAIGKMKSSENGFIKTTGQVYGVASNFVNGMLAANYLSRSKGIQSIRIGDLFQFDNMIVKDATIDFSMDDIVVGNDRRYPNTIKVTLDMSFEIVHSQQSIQSQFTTQTAVGNSPFVIDMSYEKLLADKDKLTTKTTVNGVTTTIHGTEPESKLKDQETSYLPKHPWVTEYNNQTLADKTSTGDFLDIISPTTKLGG